MLREDEEMDDKANATLICPFCAVAALRSFGHSSARCEDCGGVLGGDLLGTLHQIAALPAATGGHACECGHPEMRLLPDGVYRCPACGSEVTPVSTVATTWKSPEHSEAYWCGWLDSRFCEPACFTDNKRLAKWDEAPDRLDYYRGHRAGREARNDKGRLLEAS